MKMFVCSSLLIIVFLSATTTNCFAQARSTSKPQILLPPEDTFPKDGDLEFSCKATGFPEPQVTWFDAKTRRQFTSSQRSIHVNHALGRLTIANPVPRQTYTVYCNVSNSAGWSASDVVQAGLAYIDSEFPRFPVDTEVEEEDLILLECQPPQGNPRPTTEWLLNGSVIPPHRGQISLDGDLHIPKALLDHSGRYACRATNNAGTRTSTTAVVRVKPRAVHFIQKPKDVHANVGSTVEFSCRTSDGIQVIWRRALGEPPIDIQRAKLSAYSLSIQQIQPSDEGLYICVASDGSTAEARLSISQSTGPSFSQLPVDQNVTEGHTVIFRCRTTGSPEPSIYWDLPSQTPIFPNETLGNVHLTDLGDLEIHNVQRNDSGVYQCAAHSPFGAITTNAVLRVISRQKDAFRIPPVISLPPANQTSVVGETVILDCEVGITREPDNNYDFTLRGFDGTRLNVFWVRATRSSGDLQETIEFTHRDRDVRFSLLPGGGLQIIGVMVEDSGNYTCIVQADYSVSGHFMQSNWTAGLTVLPAGNRPSTPAPPELSPPEDLHVQNLTSSSVTLHWNPPNVPDNSGVSYWIEMFQSGEADLGWQVLQESWRPNAIRLEPIQPDVAYYFLIRPRWVDGRIGWASAPLGPIQVQRLAAPTRKSTVVRVRDLHVQVMTANTARVAWNVNKQAASTPNGFSVRYKEAPLGRCVSLIREDGSYCSLLHSTALPQRIQQYQQQLKTSSLKDTHGVSLVPSEAPQTTVEVPNDRGRLATETVLTNLNPFRCYSLEVLPYSTDNSQTAVLFLTHEDTPSQAPQIVGVKRKSNHSVEVSWTTPPAGSWNGLLTGFTVFVFNAAQNDKRELKFSYLETKGVVGGLKTGEVYHIQVTARNCRGSSEKSVPVNFSVTEAGVVNDNASVKPDFLPFQPWIIGIVVGILAIWLLAMLVAIIFCLRQRSKPKQRYPHGDPFVEASGARKYDTKERYHLEPLVKTNSSSGTQSDLERGRDMTSKAPASSNQPNTATTNASSNSSSIGGSANPISSTNQHGLEEIPQGQASDFSASPYFTHVPPQHLEYPFVDYRNVETSNNSSFSNSAGSPSTGLPLIAPVAPLTVPRDNSSSCVTPYATASLINAEMVQRVAITSPGSRTPSDMSSNPGSAHLPLMPMHSPQRYAFRHPPAPPQQPYMSRSSSGTTTGAEEDYLSHHNQPPRRRTTTNLQAPQQMYSQPPPTFEEYETCIPQSAGQHAPHVSQHQSGVPNGIQHTQVF